MTAIRRRQQLPVVELDRQVELGLFAERLRVDTNDPAVIDAAVASFGRFAVPAPDGRPPLSIRVAVDRTGDAHAAAGTPLVADDVPLAERFVHRVDRHLMSIARSVRDTATVDVDGGRATAFVTGATADDSALLRVGFLEAMALSMLARGRGYVVLHAAGIVHRGRGVVLCGPAGAGKSTLTMAAAERGFGILAEDAVFAETGPAGRLWGLPWTQRLLPDATAFFPSLAGAPLRRQPNGEDKLEIDLDVVLPGRATPCATPGPVVFVERSAPAPGVETTVEPVAPPEATAALEVLWPFDGGWTDAHAAAAARLVTPAGALRLRVAGSPAEAIGALEAALERWPAG